MDVLLPVIRQLLPTTAGSDRPTSDRWVVWRLFSGHAVFSRAATRLQAQQTFYRSRLRRFVTTQRDRVLDVISGAAEMEAEVLSVHYSDLSPFLLRPTQAEMDRLVRLEARRRMQLWEKVLYPA